MFARCQACQKPIEHEWEVYGGVNETLCVDCWYDMEAWEDLMRGYSEVYGLGPHHHDMNRTGSIIGSTVHDPLPDKPDADGWFKIADGVYYLPDHDDPYMGLWRYYHQDGNR